ncbi:hypothetical protein ACOMHN_008084 [Nucella lapillus]
MTSSLEESSTARRGNDVSVRQATHRSRPSTLDTPSLMRCWSPHGLEGLQTAGWIVHWWAQRHRLLVGTASSSIGGHSVIVHWWAQRHRPLVGTASSSIGGHSVIVHWWAQRDGSSIDGHSVIVHW